jgi:VIT1/CCC1 family predicted Fe2+/Mn2+ transporter
MAGRSVAGTALRQLVVAVLAAGVTFGVGHLLGVQAT